jgi:hypothetical protein
MQVVMPDMQAQTKWLRSPARNQANVSNL